MTKRREKTAGSASTRFKKGQSGNPKGRPPNPKKPPPSPFAILDEALSVQEQEGVSELPLEDAMLMKTYQRAIAGSRRAGKKIVKMILEREKRRFNGRTTQFPRVKKRVEQVDPENAVAALEVLGVASRRASSDPDDRTNGSLRLERWAVEAALRRRNLQGLSSSDKILIRNSMHDGADVRWPSDSRDPD